MRYLGKILAWRLRQEDLKLQTSLGYIGGKEKNKGEEIKGKGGGRY